MKIGWVLKNFDKFVYFFCPNTGTKFREPYQSNHVIPHRGEAATIHTHIHIVFEF